MSPDRPHVGFVLESILGHATHAKNLQRLVPQHEGIDPEFCVLPFAVDGFTARIPVFRSNWSVRAGVRARQMLRAAAGKRQLDGLFVHTQVPAILIPDWLRKLPSVVSIDATPRQLDSLGTPYQHTVHPTAVESAKWRANRLCFRRATHIVAWSDWAKQGLIDEYEVPAAKVSVVAPGVNLETWRRPASPSGDGPVRLLFVGGDLERKGGNVLIEAVARVRAAHPDIELHLVTGAAVPVTSGLRVHNGLTPNDPRLIELYHQADVFCLPTLGDCLPLVLAEAGAAGLPLVSTAVGAIPGIVQPDRSGMLVPPGDVDALVKAINELVENPGLRRRLGDGAAALVAAEHDAAKNAGRIVELLQQTIRERNR